MSRFFRRIEKTCSNEKTHMQKKIFRKLDNMFHDL